MGMAIPGGRFDLIDDHGMIISQSNAAGELVYYGDNVAFGYAVEGNDLIKGDENHGRLFTGDIAKRDEEGFYFIVGRKKRFLKVFGNRVNLDEVERLVKDEFDGTECVCGGMDDKIYIFTTEQREENEIRRFIAHKTGFNHSVFVVKHINEIPKNEAGKVLYRELEQYYD